VQKIYFQPDVNLDLAIAQMVLVAPHLEIFLRCLFHGKG
jgi:hypothetical protein